MGNTFDRVRPLRALRGIMLKRCMVAAAGATDQQWAAGVVGIVF